MFDIEELYEPTSVAQAVQLMQAHPEAKILAGGSDLLLQIREGKLAGISCISIFKIDQLRGICLEEGTVVIRPMTSFSHVAASPVVLEKIPVLCEAVETVGGPQLRNVATIGGNICNGVTSADSASTLLALDAQLELTGAEGVRTLPLAEFYTGPGKVALKPAELLTAIRIHENSYSGYFGHYIKYAMRNAMDISTLNCSVNCKLSPDGKTFEDVRIAFGVAAPVPIRCPQAEKEICGQAVNQDAITRFSKAVLQEITPRTSWRASKEFRMHIASELAFRALKEAVRKSGGTIQ